MNDIKAIKSMPPEKTDLESVYLSIITNFTKVPEDGLVWVVIESVDGEEYRGKLIAMDKESAIICTDGDLNQNELPATMLIRNVVKIICYH